MILIQDMLCLRIVHKHILSKHLFTVANKVSMYSSSTNNIYFRCIEDSEQFQVSFQCQYTPLNIDRQFNFSRQLTEPVETFIGRIKTNLEKVLTKKKKRKQKKGDSSVLQSSEEDINVKIVSDGVEVPGSVKCKELFFNGNFNLEKLQFCILDKCYKVVLNSPWVTDLNLPTCIMVGFPVYPNKIKILFGDKDKSQLTWFKAVGDEWSEVGTGFIYTPTTDELGCKIKLKVTPGNGSIVGPETEAISNSAVQTGPGHCPFHTRHTFTVEPPSDTSFRVVSYNILADVYAETEAAKTELFPYCPSYAMALDYRKQLYLEELLGYNANIICLQEVDLKVFEYDLKHVLASQGSEGVFAKKGGTINEGIATFYSTNRFRLIDSYRVVLGEEVESDPVYANIWEKIKVNESVATRLKEKPTAVQALVLECLERPNEKIVVGNTHLYFSPDADHIRLIQGGLIMAFLNRVVNNTLSTYPDNRVSLLICGDFNSVPECGVYQLMTTKHVPEDFVDWKAKEGEEVEGLQLSQPYSIASAYGTPEYTNFTVGFVGCLDYIYYQTDSLEVKQIVPLPSDEEFRAHTAIPSVLFPSDHVALVADLGWK